MNRVAGSLLVLCFLIVGACSPATVTQSDEPGDGEFGDPGADSVPGALAFDQPTLSLDTLRIGLTRPTSYLPYELSSGDQSAVIVSDLLYDGLTEAVGTEGRLRPALASAWVANDDFTEWTFTIDSERSSAAEVVAHYRRLLEGSRDLGVSVLLQSVTSLEEVAADEVRFLLDGPTAGLPWLLSGTALSVVGENGLPTGRYDVASDDRNGMVLFADGRPQIVLSWAETTSDAYDDLTLGLVDAAVAPSARLGDARSRFGFEPSARSISRFYVINAESPVFADERVQEAILGAVDRNSLAASGFGSPVFAIDGVVSPTVAGYEPVGCGVPCEFAPERATALIDAVVAESASEVVLTIAVTGAEQRLTAELLAAQLNAVGVAALIVDMNFDELAAALATGEADLVAFGWANGAGSLDAVVPPLFGSRSPVNGSGVASEAVDNLVERAAMIADDHRRWAVLSDAHRAAMGEGRVLPLVAASSLLVTAPQAEALVMRADGSIDIEATK